MRTPYAWGMATLLAAYGITAWAEPAIHLGGKLPQSDKGATLWWALSSATKIRPDTTPLEQPSPAVCLRCACNESESVQVVIRPVQPLHHLEMHLSSLTGPSTSAISTNELDVLKAEYVNVAVPSDKSTEAGLWPDPLVPVRKPLDLEGGLNHAFWIRVHVPSQTSPGVYRGQLRLKAEDWSKEVPIELTVYGFQLPERLTCQTAFGFSPGEVFRYQHLSDEASRRQVLEKYWANFSAHHISPYDPAPLDAFKVSWPQIKPPRTQAEDWTNLRLVQNEVHSGKGALLIYDDKPDVNLTVSYQPLVPIPAKGLHLSGWFRTAVPGHRFTVSLNHYDGDKQWLSGRNRDFVLLGNGQWQKADYVLTDFPAGAKYVRLNLMGAVWTEAGENQGLVWFDDISIKNEDTGEELVRGGDFEPVRRTELVAPAEQLRATFDFAAWDRAMTRAFETYHFNAFSVPIPGLGGGTFHELFQPSLIGFGEDAPEYPLLLNSYCRQLEEHLRAKGWLSFSYVYWFDEPSPDQYPYLQNGFSKLKKYCPDIPRMITKLVEPGLIGGPNLWCPISDQFQPEPAQGRRKFGERFWWYVCTGPKAPYAGLFLDHRAPEMRIWLWQTFQRDIEGILVWQCNYWTSDTAYPEAGKPQNPYTDPMSWTTGYGTPVGKKLPWGNGDGRFIYPSQGEASANGAGPILDGPVDSIRWEQLRDGLEDYEYLVLLRHKLNSRRSSLSPAQVKQYEGLLVVPESISKSMTEFATEGAPIEMRREQIARAIESML